MRIVSLVSLMVCAGLSPPVSVHVVVLDLRRVIAEAEVTSA